MLDIFAHVCKQLWADDLERLRRYSEEHGSKDRLSTWLVVVVRNRLDSAAGRPTPALSL